MAKLRKTRNKKDLERLSRWPVPRTPDVKASRGKDRPEREAQAPGPFRAPAHNLPSLYNETYLRLLPRDPHFLFSFWEVPAPYVEGATLRLYETENGRNPKIVGHYPVERGLRSRYIRVPIPGRTYRMEYGTGTHGRFVSICASNEVSVPLGRTSQRYPVTETDASKQAAAEVLIGLSTASPPSAASRLCLSADLTAIDSGI